MQPVNVQSIINGTSIAVQLAQAAAPSIAKLESGSDKTAAIAGLMQVAGAGVQAYSGDPEVQAEAQAATSFAVSILPALISIFGLFHKAKPAAASA